MLRISYVSRTNERLTTSAFDRLVAASTENNWRDGITGLLLFDGSRFLQAIEGRSAAVTACYARITADERHHSIVPIDWTDGAEREFGDWSLRALDSAKEPMSFRRDVDAAVAGVSEPRLRATFIGFARLAR